MTRTAHAVPRTRSGSGACTASDAMERDLRITLRTLHASDISAAAQVTGDGRIQVWLGDRTRGVCDAAFFALDESAQAADWLAERAIKYFPKSDFARVHRLIAQAAATIRSKPA